MWSTCLGPPSPFKTVLGWTAEDVSVVKDEYRGIRMLRPSPTMQLRDWGVDSYEEFCIQEAYYLP